MLEFQDHRRDPAAWSASLGISREAIEIYLKSDVIDLHIDSFIWTRVFRYDLTRRHGHGLLGARFYSQADLPRLREARVTGGVWAITTNPLVPARLRGRLFLRNLERLRAIFAQVPDDVAIVRTAGEYRRARAADRHAAFFAIQGGNAIEDGALLDQIPDGLLSRVTLVHLSTSSFGATSSPLAGKRAGGLTANGREFVRRLNERRIFVDLAHINRQGFFDAVDAHDRTQPLLVSHTGISGVHRHWRNLDDEQLRAVAATGGTIGVMYQSSFLGDPVLGGRAVSIVNHLEHIVRVVGEDHASLGSDWDGAIMPPRDLPTCLELPRLVQLMLDRGWSAERIAKILGGNYLRALALLRGED
jgi:membrane dipeptidase